MASPPRGVDGLESLLYSYSHMRSRHPVASRHSLETRRQQLLSRLALPADEARAAVNTVPSGPALAQIRESAQALLAQGKVDETWEFFLAALDAVLMKNRELELLVLKLRRERLGRHTERLDPRQIALLFD